MDNLINKLLIVDPTIRDEAGLTPLLYINTLSAPNEEVMKVLVEYQDAEKAKRYQTPEKPRRKLRADSPFPPLPPPFPAVKDRQRQPWFYAVLYRGCTVLLPGMVQATKGNEFCTTTKNVSNCFPVDDILLLGSTEYHGLEYDLTTSSLKLGIHFRTLR